MDYLQYSQDFQINSYSNALPPYVRQIILDAYGEISTLGELKECADVVDMLDKKRFYFLHVINDKLFVTK